MTSFSVSASQLKLYQLCPRSWYLKHVLRVPDDQGAGGLYLTLGNDFDRLVQLHVRDGVTGDSGAPKLANRQLTEAGRHLPLPRTAEVQFSYDIDAGGFHVRGKPDIRRPAWVKDTKTTSDRGPGRGKDKDSPPYALTDAHTPGGNVRPLADDVQARLYAWCEFQLDPALASVYAEWVYVSKADCPVCWTSAVDFDRADTLAWFDTVVRPIVARMMAYTKLHAEHPGNLHAEDIGANPDSCRRCFVRAACPGAFDGVNVYGITPPKEPRKPNMAFDLSKLRTPATATATAPPVVDPVAQLEASIAAVCDQVAAVAINRPASERSACSVRVEPDLTVTERPLVVHSIEGSAAALAMLAYEPPGHDDSANAPSDVTGETAATPPKARRGRPRTRTAPGASGAATAVAAEPIAVVIDPDQCPIEGHGPKGQAAQLAADPTDSNWAMRTMTAPACAPSAGDRDVAVSALVVQLGELVGQLAVLARGAL